MHVQVTVCSTCTCCNQCSEIYWLVFVFDDSVIFCFIDGCISICPSFSSRLCGDWCFSFFRWSLVGSSRQVMDHCFYHDYHFSLIIINEVGMLYCMNNTSSFRGMDLSFMYYSLWWRLWIYFWIKVLVKLLLSWRLLILKVMWKFSANVLFFLNCAWFKQHSLVNIL